MNQLKKSWIFLAVCLAVILVSSLFASLIQSDWGTVQVTDLRGVTNSGAWADDSSVTVKGSVVSGILFVPKEASADNKLPAVVLTHGYLNNRELQLQNAIELARRGFVVLTVDREAHGNYENKGSTSSLFTRGLYDAAKYLYNLDYVDQSKIGVSGHSMGGFDTAATLMEDAPNVADLAMSTVGTFAGDIGRTDLTPENGYGLGIISAGLLQAWDSFPGAGEDVSVGILKADDDEFFFGATSWSAPGNTLADGTPSLARQYLESVYGANFVGISSSGSIDIQNGGIYENGAVVNVPEGTAAGAPFRVIYQNNEIHPLNHFSVKSAADVTNFFYTAFGTPSGASYIPSTNEAWWIKETFSCIGLLAFFALVIPLARLLLAVPFFNALRKRKDVLLAGESPLKGVQGHLTYWLVGIAVTLFAGFSIRTFVTKLGTEWFPLTPRYPQNTTNWVVTWAVAVGLFALAAILVAWGINALINRIRFGKDGAGRYPNPFASARIEGGIGALAKTLLLAVTIVGILYCVLFIVWGVLKVDFRIWSFDVKVFNVAAMLPTMLRYAVLFGIFYCINSIFNQNYRAKNLPEWVSVAINAFFNVAGILLVMIIQYSTFKSTGVLWQPDMNLGYIVLFPIIPILIIATIISRVLYKKTGNAWLGGFVNALLFTIITVANTCSAFAYILG